MRLTILCENTVPPARGLIGEHGFAVLIETDGGMLVFDTGSGQGIVHNAERLKKELGKVDKVFLSHGHYDHTGGLERLLRLTGRVSVYAHPDVFVQRFAVLTKGGRRIEKEVGIPQEKAFYESLGACFVLNRDFSEVEPGMFLTGEIPRQCAFEAPDQRLVFKAAGRETLDPVRDDQALVIRTRAGLVVVLGCAHAGIVNTLQFVTSRLPDHKLHMVVGGTHIGFHDEERIEQTIEVLAGFEIERLGVSHCTGLDAAARLKQAFGETFFFANAGSTIEVQA